MAELLSDEWIGELHRAAASHAGLRDASAGLDLVVQQVITTADGPDVAFHVVFDHGVVAVQPGRAAAPTVTFTQDDVTAREIHAGELSAQAAFMAGRVRIGGDHGALVGAGTALAGLDDVFATVRATSTNPPTGAPGR